MSDPQDPEPTAQGPQVEASGTQQTFDPEIVEAAVNEFAESLGVSQEGSQGSPVIGPSQVDHALNSGP